jgi:hypothetical protein
MMHPSLRSPTWVWKNRRTGPALAALGFVGATLVVPACGLIEVNVEDQAQEPTEAGGGPPTSAPATTTVPAPPLPDPFTAIADRTTMTAEARDLLARSGPHLVDRAGLGEDCTLDPELSVLGCYREGRIAVLDVTEPRLDGMTETTTAHEMLHAAWEQLDDGQRAELATQLQAAYERVADEELTARVEAYRARDPEVVDNELHSILGTETADVGPELEAYYGRWFADRQQLVTLASGARQTFTDLQDQVDELDSQLADLRTGIDAGEQVLTDDRASVEAESAELDTLRDAGQIDEYNAGVDPYNQHVADYNQAVADHQALVDDYNDLVTERNDLAAAYTDLVDQVTTTAESVPE